MTKTNFKNKQFFTYEFPLQDFFASVQQATKTNANGRASESNCFELRELMTPTYLNHVQRN